MPTKEAFIAAYTELIRTHCAWASDTGRLAAFVQTVRNTIVADGHLPGGGVWGFDASSAIQRQAWQLAGGKGRLTLKGLRALPQS